jgi:hypothetical protein
MSIVHFHCELVCVRRTKRQGDFKGVGDHPRRKFHLQGKLPKSFLPSLFLFLLLAFNPQGRKTKFAFGLKLELELQIKFSLNLFEMETTI